MTAYCGRCWWDRGRLVILTVLSAVGKDGAKRTPFIYGCSFCGEERHEGGSHLRVSLTTGGDHRGEENVVRIPHIVIL